MYFDGGRQTFSVVTDRMGVMRKFQAEGRKAQARNKRDPNQVKIEELEGEHKDLPF